MDQYNSYLSSFNYLVFWPVPVQDYFLKLWKCQTFGWHIERSTGKPQGPCWHKITKAQNKHTHTLMAREGFKSTILTFQQPNVIN